MGTEDRRARFSCKHGITKRTIRYLLVIQTSANGRQRSEHRGVPGCGLTPAGVDTVHSSVASSFDLAVSWTSCLNSYLALNVRSPDWGKALTHY